MKAMILAAGNGTRLGSLKADVPKVMMSVGGRPLLCRTFAWLKSHGITQVAINIHCKGEKIIELIGSGAGYGMSVAYSHEETLLGTAGAVKTIQPFFKGTFVVVYGDILTDFDLTAMVRYHKEKKAAATLALIAVSDPSAYGIVETAADGRVTRFLEKPKPGATASRLASAAVYVLEKEVLDYIPEKCHYDFGYDVFPKLLAAGLPVYGYTLGTGDYWLDIGTPEKYRQADKDIKAGRLKKTDAVGNLLPGNT